MLGQGVMITVVLLLFFYLPIDSLRVSYQKTKQALQQEESKFSGLQEKVNAWRQADADMQKRFGLHWWQVARGPVESRLLASVASEFEALGLQLVQATPGDAQLLLEGAGSYEASMQLLTAPMHIPMNVTLKSRAIEKGQSAYRVQLVFGFSKQGGDSH